MTIKPLVLALSILTAAMSVHAAESDSVKSKETMVDYRPAIHGVMRARFDQLTVDGGKGRFAVPNARVSLRGNVAPFASYFIHVDFCDKGKVKILDAYATLSSRSGLKLMAGQMRVPFSVDASRTIETYIFTHKSFIGRYIGNFRAVGFKASWQPKSIPLYVEGGVFNATPMADHTAWQNDYTYGIKSRLTLGNTFVEGGFSSRCPYGIRMNMYDAALHWASGRWMLEAEYAAKLYAGQLVPTCHAYNFIADYRMPIRTEWFNRMSLQGRFDGTTDHCSGQPNDDGELVTDYPNRQRITAGVTLSHIEGKIGFDVRLNYDQYLTKNKLNTAKDDGNRVSLEVIMWF